MKIFSIKVASANSPTYRTMTQRNEKDLIEARKAFYDKTNKENNTLRKAEITGIYFQIRIVHY